MDFDDGKLEDLPGSSLLAIKRRRTAIGSELRAHVYRYANRKFLVTSVMSVRDSLIVETGQPSTLGLDVADGELGRVVCDHLLRHDARVPPNRRDTKITDWAVFKASGDTSVTGFNRKSSTVAVQTINLLLAVEAAPVRSLHPEIAVRGVAQPQHEELGAVIRRVLKASDILRREGII